MWMQNWKKMWVSMIGTRYGSTKVDEKVDVIKNIEEMQIWMQDKKQ